MRIDFLIKTIMIVLFVLGAFVFFVDISKAANWKADPKQCPTTYSGQLAGPGEVMCGLSGSVAQWYNSSTLFGLVPGVNSTNNNGGGTYGGYVVDCDYLDAAAPYCDNSGSFWCSPSSSCNTLNRVTECVAGKWASQPGATNCSVCKTGYYDCNADGLTCEIHDGASCTTDEGLPGTYSGCNGSVGFCVPNVSNFITGITSTYLTSSALLRGIQLGTGDLIHFNKNGVATSSFVVFNSGQVAIGHNINVSTTSVAFEVSSTQRGILIPRLGSNMELDSVNNIDGHLYYNTTSHKFRYYNGTAWSDLGGGLPSGDIGQLLVNNGGENWVTSSIFKIITNKYGIAMNANVVAGNWSAAFGNGNSTTGTFSFIAGGYQNKIESGSEASSIGGGTYNTVSGSKSFIANGGSNNISGGFSFIGSAEDSSISGNYSTIFGRRMTISGNDSFGISLSDAYNTITNSNTMAIMGGNVGIGTVSPLTLLSVAGTSTLRNVIPDMTGGTGNMSVYNLGASTTRWNALWVDNLNIGTSTWSIKQNGTRLGFYTQANGEGSNNLNILENGRVGIGTSTPLAKLHVEGGSIDIVSSTGVLSISSNVSSSGYTGFAHYIANDAVLGSYLPIGFRTHGVTRLFIEDGGNIGIGTTSPSGILHTVATSYDKAPIFERSASGNSKYTALKVSARRNVSSADGMGPGIDFISIINSSVDPYGNISSNSSSTVASIAGLLNGSSSSTGRLAFYTNNEGSLTEKMTIDNNGNVGIGTTTAWTKLHVHTMNSYDGILLTGNTSSVGGALVMNQDIGNKWWGVLELYDTTNNIGVSLVGHPGTNNSYIRGSFAVGSQNSLNSTFRVVGDTENGNSSIVSFASSTGINVFSINNDGSIAMGYGSAALGKQGSFSIGNNNTAMGTSSFALGTGSYAGGAYSIAFGKNVTTTNLAYYSFAGGEESQILSGGLFGNVVSNNSFAFGYKAIAGGVTSFAFGEEAWAGYYTVLGFPNFVNHAVAIGKGAKSRGGSSYALGWQSIVDEGSVFSYALGAGATIGMNNTSSYAIGDNAKVSNNINYGFSLGQYYTNSISSSLGIGFSGSGQTSNPALHVRGSGTSATRVGIGAVNVSNWRLVVDAGASGQLGVYINGSAQITNLSGNGTHEVCVDNSGILYSSFGSCTQSDVRFKKEIISINAEKNVLEALTNLRGIYYYWNTSTYPTNDDRRQIGVVAQELELVLPELVYTDVSTTYKSVDYPKLTAFLIEVAKVQQAEIEALREAVSTTLSVQQSGGSLTYSGGDLDLQNYALLNVKNITGVDNKWAIDENGQFITRIQTSDGNTKEMFAMQSPYSEFVFSSSSELINGEAIINFDTDTCELIDETQPLKVNITLTGECGGIYVKEKLATGFVVKELNGGISSSTFDWMVIAKRKFVVTPPPAPPQEGGEGEVMTPPLQGGEEGMVETPSTTEEIVTTTPPVEEPTPPVEEPTPPAEEETPPAEEPTP